jgi:formamidopyrimidine-DNA glycosylase
VPELPDVEIFKQDFDSAALHHSIHSVHVRNGMILRNLTPQRLALTLRRRQFQTTRRHGKFLFITVDPGGACLVLHFGMTGFLKYFTGKHEEPLHTRLLIDFADGTHLAFSCQRLFGRVTLTQDPDAFIKTQHLGPDALTLTWEQFRRRVSDRARAVKSVLMDQQVLAGIGNIYSDEILFRARIHPLTKASSLDKRQLHAIYKATGYVLKTAIKSRADPTRVPRSWLLRHRKSSASCPRCHGTIDRIKFNQRSTYVCSRCQQKAS